MKNLLRFLLLLFAVYIFLPAPAWAATVKVETVHSRDRYQAGGSYPLLLRLKVAKGWYIHGIKEGDDYLIPTILSFRESPVQKVDGIKFPEPEKKKFNYTSGPVELYSGEIHVYAALHIPEDVPAGEHVIKGTLSYQACSSSSCLPPENVTIAVPLVIVPAGTSTTALNQELFSRNNIETGIERGMPGGGSGATLWLTLLGIFVGGLALNLTPCIYPLIPITDSYFGGKIKENRVLHGLLYISGLALTNSILGVSAALSGSMLGSALQKPVVLILVACIMIALGLSFFDLWEIRIPAGLTSMASRSFGGYFGTFFIGLTLGIVAAPCLWPFILGLLTYVGQKGDPFLGFLYFFVLSIGLGLPLALLAIFSGAMDRLPLSGDWMVWIRRFMGWVLVGMAGYMISPLIAHHMARAGIMAVISIAAGFHLGWLDRTGGGVRAFSYIKKALAVLIILGGMIYLGSAGYDREGIEWIPYDRDILSRAAEAKRPLILDFSADWCAPCREMERKVFNDPDVVRLSRDFITMRLDLTRRQAYQEEVLRRYSVRGVPTIIFFTRHGVEERGLRIESYADRSEFLSRMRLLLERSPTNTF